MGKKFAKLRANCCGLFHISTLWNCRTRRFAAVRREPTTLPRPKRRSSYSSDASVWVMLRSEEHTSELQSRLQLVCRLLLEKKLTKMQLYNQKEIAEMQNETQKEIAGIQSATSRQNTKDQVYAQNEMLAYQQKESTARVASIMENTNLSKQQQVSEIMRQMLTQAQTAGQYFT